MALLADITCEQFLPGRPVLRSVRAWTPVGGSEGSAAGAAAPAEDEASSRGRHTRTRAGADFRSVGTLSSDGDDRPMWGVCSRPPCSPRTSRGPGFAQPSTLSGSGALR